jgi:Carboxypeptidase regulatory-like domain
MKYLVGIISFGLLALGQNPASAGTVYGRVFDTLRNSGNGAILANAKVTLRSDPQRTVTTDTYGQYRFENIPEGAYLIRIQAPKRDEVVTRLVVRKGVTIANLDFSKILAPDEDDEY